MMKRNPSALPTPDLTEMLGRLKTLHEQDAVLELIEISESFEAAMNRHGLEGPQDHEKFLMILGLACEMERRMKELESTLERIRTRIQALSGQGMDSGLTDTAMYRVPDCERDEICE